MNVGLVAFLPVLWHLTQQSKVRHVVVETGLRHGREKASKPRTIILFFSDPKLRFLVPGLAPFCDTPPLSPSPWQLFAPEASTHTQAASACLAIFMVETYELLKADRVHTVPVN
jgi:hypothetical protein